jgi:hypothetical protein
VYVENAVIQTRRLELFLEARYIDEIGKFVLPGSAGNIRVRIEIKLIRSAANAGLQRALDRVAADIVGAGVQLGIQQRLRMANVILCQLVEVIAVHLLNAKYDEGEQFLTLIHAAAGNCVAAVRDPSGAIRWIRVPKC